MALNTARRSRRMAALASLIALALPALGSSMACSRHAFVVEGGGQTFLMTNLHPDGHRRIVSVNYTSPRGGTLLPLCTPVTIERIQTKRITFRVDTTGLRYTYTLHRSSRSPIDAHVQRYFGTQCPDLRTMSPEDQAGVQNGQVYQGMTKQGVIMAIGYPPEHKTPTLDGDVWRYWASSINTFEVYFTDGVVTGIRN